MYALKIPNFEIGLQVGLQVFSEFPKIIAVMLYLFDPI
jgi:hypothetical protein